MKTQAIDVQRFCCLLAGYKTFIVQRENTGYRIGNVIRFLEMDSLEHKPTGRHCAFTMIYREPLDVDLDGDRWEIIGLRRIPVAATAPTLEESFLKDSS